MFSIKVKRNNKFEVFHTKNPEFIVGRASDCDIAIPSDVISRHHLKIAMTVDEMFIMDLKSANGTFINGQRLDPQKPYVITEKDLIRLGNMPDEIQIYDVREQQDVLDSADIKPTANNVPKPPQPKAPLKLTAVPPVMSLQEVSKKVEAIIEGAKKKAREIIDMADAESEAKMNKTIESAENIIRDAKEQATKIVINAEESTKVIIKKAKFDAETIVEKANVQAKHIVNKSVAEAELAVEEGRRRGESLVSSELLQIENEKIKLKEIWLEEEKKLRAEFNKVKEDELEKHKKFIFEEKEKIRKEIDEKRTAFAKELLKKQETLRIEESDVLSKKYILENEIEALQQKEEQLKGEYAQKSLALKIKYEEEKSKSEVEIAEMKKKYNDEIEVYKKKEMDRVIAQLRQEQSLLNENKKIQAVQTSYSLKRAVVGVLDQELGKFLEQEQINDLLQKISAQVDKTTQSIEEEKVESAAQVIELSTEKKVQKRSSKTAAVFGLSACIAALLVFAFWDSILDSVKKSESYAKFMFDKMQIESVYIPIQSEQWRNTYHERVLYLKDYVDFKTNQLYMDKWTQHLTNVENARSLKLTEDEMIQFLAREINLVNQIASLQKTIDARQLELGIAKLRNAEEEANADFIKILKSKDNLQVVQDWEKQFVMEHMSRMRAQRLPTNQKSDIK
ncbi:FHA domain-containing protein [bacterium]|nr:FHA domain-containing protein [bacterium]